MSINIDFYNITLMLEILYK